MSQDVSHFVCLGLLRLPEFMNADFLSSRFDLPYWSSEPLSSPEKPATKGPCANDTHGYRRVVKTLICHWVYCREAEDNGDKTDPRDSHNPNRLGENSEAKWSTLKIAGIYQFNQNREAI